MERIQSSDEEQNKLQTIQVCIVPPRIRNEEDGGNIGFGDYDYGDCETEEIAGRATFVPIYEENPPDNRVRYVRYQDLMPPVPST